MTERLDKAGADLVSLSERIEASSAAGKMLFRLLGVLNEFERDLVSERTAAALQHKKAIGERVGTVPYGFDLADDGKTLIENADEQAVIGGIRDLRAAGKSFRRIAKVLTERSVPTKSGRSTVRVILWQPDRAHMRLLLGPADDGGAFSLPARRGPRFADRSLTRL